MFLFYSYRHPRELHSFPTRRSSDLESTVSTAPTTMSSSTSLGRATSSARMAGDSEEHTSELQSRFDLVCRLLLEKKKLSTRRGTSWSTSKQAICSTLARTSWAWCQR